MLDNKRFYLGAYKRYGISAKGLNWNSKESQEIRFEIITSFIRDELEKSSILDVGCGFGDIILFWQKRGIKPREYIGIDSVEKFVKISTKRFSSLDFVKILHRDILIDNIPRSDWLIASGSLNILSEFDSWFFIERMLEYSKRGVVFNILKGEKKSENFNYKTREEMEEFLISKDLKFEIVEGYLPNDMSIKVYK